MASRSSSRVTLIWGTLGALAFGALFASAGNWQYGRYQQKLALFAAFDQGSRSAALAGLPADTDFAAMRYQPLRLEGRYDPDRQVLLDNAVVDGRVGYFALTPFLTAAGTVLVNRGFVPAPPERSQLPEIPVDGQPRAIAGIIDALPRPGLRLAEPDPGADAPWPRRIVYPDIGELAAMLGYPVRDFQLLLDAAEPDGYRRRWTPSTMPPETHLGYAVQWFGLLAAVAVVYFLLLWRYLRSRRP